jgi:hypothetical protein
MAKRSGGRLQLRSIHGGLGAQTSALSPRQVVPPWHERRDPSHDPWFAAHFRAQDCAACPTRSLCTRLPRQARLFKLLPREQHEALQQVVEEQGLVPSIHFTTVAHILARASLQPHRSRYWKTARLDEEFVHLAAKVLWCYEAVDWLHRGEKW